MTKEQNNIKAPMPIKRETAKTHALEPVQKKHKNNTKPAQNHKPLQEHKTKSSHEHKAKNEQERKAGQDYKAVQEHKAVKYPIKKSHYRNMRNNNFKPHKQSLAEKLIRTFTSLISKGIKTILPWTLLSMVLFILGAYYTFYACFTNHGYPLWYMITAGLLLFGFYSILGLFFGMGMGILYTIKSFSEAFGQLIRETINRVKNSIESKIDNVADTLSKNEASKVVKQTFDELTKNIRKHATKTAAGVTALTLLGGVLFICKKTMLISFSTIKNKADFFAILSARAALAAAIILNLTFFTKLAIAAGYLIGLIMFGIQAFMVVLLK